MKILDDTALTFDDVQLVPNYSEVTSRMNVGIESYLTNKWKIPIPLIAAPMDTVCGTDMIIALQDVGAAGCLHRFMSIAQQVEDMKFVRDVIGEKLSWDVGEIVPICAAIGVTRDYKDRAEKLVDAGANILLIDVANGDHILVKQAMEWINKQSWRARIEIILGNIVSTDGAKRLVDWGADAIRCGIGSGSRCSTRINTGVGIPQLTAIDNVLKGCGIIPVISDGGARYPGDVAKALAAGASTVMCGSMFAGTNEAPGDILISENKKMKVFRGSASRETKLANNQDDRNIEGISGLIDIKGSVRDIVISIEDGLRSSFSYVGAYNIFQFRQNAKFVRITNAGLIEAHPRL